MASQLHLPSGAKLMGFILVKIEEYQALRGCLCQTRLFKHTIVMPFCPSFPRAYVTSTLSLERTQILRRRVTHNLMQH